MTVHNPKRVALITGVTGQDGAYLAELLLKKGYEVHGIKRRSSLFNTDRIDHLYQDPHVADQRLVLHYGDLSDSTNLIRIVQQVQPDEIYNLGAQSHVRVSFDAPEYTADITGTGTIRLLEAIRESGIGINPVTDGQVASMPLNSRSASPVVVIRMLAKPPLVGI